MGIHPERGGGGGGVRCCLYLEGNLCLRIGWSSNNNSLLALTVSQNIRQNINIKV